MEHQSAILESRRHMTQNPTMIVVAQLAACVLTKCKISTAEHQHEFEQRHDENPWHCDNSSDS
jgi:hypothetical protein